jgi:hypothetical protein
MEHPRSRFPNIKTTGALPISSRTINLTGAQKGTTKATSPTKDGTPSESSRTPIQSTQVATPPTSKPIQNQLHRPQKPIAPTGPRHPGTPNAPLIDSYRDVPRGPASITPQLPAGWKSAFDLKSGKHYYYRPSDGKRTWEFPTEDTEREKEVPTSQLPKSEFQKIIDGASRQVAEKLEKERLEEERRLEREAEEEREMEEAKKKERAERRAKREQRHLMEQQQQHRRQLSQDSSPKKSRLEKEMEIFV